MARGVIHIGTSGWHYASWVGPFYPPGTRPADFLPIYARTFRTVEVNNTFYRLPDRATFRSWRAVTPPGFLFACKASRYLTHMKKLKAPRAAVRRFFRRVEVLGPRLGPVLFQLPPRWGVDADRLERFLRRLPVRRRAVFEFRDRSWFTPVVYDVLERHGAACCVYELGGWRSPIVPTADFIYVRLHGPAAPYAGQYDGRTLGAWARRVRGWALDGRDVYCYFDNDQAGHAPRDARRLIRMVTRGKENTA
jgi:uncharacterized protein YecE (DUF72 family)